MRYDYLCHSCGAETEVVRSIKDAPAPVSCSCGAEMRQQFCDIEVIVKGGERPFKLDPLCVPVGWEHGNTDPEKQERRYKRIIERDRKAARANDKAAIKGGIRKIATVPRELHRMRTNQYGKDYYETDTKQKLKSDGLLFRN